MNRYFLLGIIALTFGALSKAEAGPCSSKPALMESSENIQQIDKAVRNFNSLKASGMAEAILAIKKPTSALVEELLREKKSIRDKLLEELKDQSMTDLMSIVSIINQQRLSQNLPPLSNQEELFATFLSYAKVNVYGIFRIAIYVIMGTSFGEIHIAALNTASQDSEVMKALTSIARTFKNHQFSWKLFSKKPITGFHSEAQASATPWIRKCISKMNFMNSETMGANIFYLSEIYLLAWMVKHGFKMREEVLRDVATNMSIDLDYSGISNEIARHTWKVANIRTNPYIIPLRSLFDPNMKTMSILCSVKKVPRLGKVSILKTFPPDLIRVLSEYLID